MALNRNLGVCLPACAGRAVVLCVILFGMTPADAGIRLEWRTTTPVVCVNQDFDVGLYAASTNAGENETFTGMVIGFAWDQTSTPVPPTLPTPPQHLRLLSVTCNINPNLGTCQLRFPDTPCQVNEASLPADGDGVLLVNAVSGQAVTAIPNGALLATFRFRAIAATPAARIETLSRFGRCKTSLTDNCGGCCGFEFGDIKIAVGCTLAVEACCLPDQTCVYATRQNCSNQGGVSQGATAPCRSRACGRTCPCAPDMDGNNRIDGRDVQGFIDCFIGCGANCDCADINRNGRLEGSDLALFSLAVLSSSTCP